ncbi:MAG: hypothetical protein J0I92_05915, partial [Phyllobacterium sp.]|nr:hypothetical protein [Phyllobacterium sp.]
SQQRTFINPYTVISNIKTHFSASNHHICSFADRNGDISRLALSHSSAQIMALVHVHARMP